MWRSLPVRDPRVELVDGRIYNVTKRRLIQTRRTRQRRKHEVASNDGLNERIHVTIDVAGTRNLPEAEAWIVWLANQPSDRDSNAPLVLQRNHWSRRIGADNRCSRHGARRPWEKG